MIGRLSSCLPPWPLIVSLLLPRNDLAMQEISYDRLATRPETEKLRKLERRKCFVICLHVRHEITDRLLPPDQCDVSVIGLAGWTGAGQSGTDGATRTIREHQVGALLTTLAPRRDMTATETQKNAVCVLQEVWREDGLLGSASKYADGHNWRRRKTAFRYVTSSPCGGRTLNTEDRSLNYWTAIKFNLD
jgi:hypothetical protein